MRWLLALNTPKGRYGGVGRFTFELQAALLEVEQWLPEPSQGPFIVQSESSQL